MTEYKCPKWEEVYTKELTLQALFEKLIDIENRMKDEVFILTERIDKLEGETKMIEMRIVLHKNRIKPEIQYRFMLFPIGQGGYLCPPNETMKWSEWRTAEWINAEDIENE